jgi:hypothetical protein
MTQQNYTRKDLTIDIEFGYAASTLNPYCTCSTPLTKGNYIFGAVMPLIILT